MIVWQYCIYELVGSPSGLVLNTLGQEGWELVHSMPVILEGGRLVAMALIFKRPWPTAEATGI
jgi:hypothetical protein